MTMPGTPRWIAEIVHYTYPKPKVMSSGDIRIEYVAGSLESIAAYLQANIRTVHRATVAPPCGALMVPEGKLTEL